MSKKSMIIIGAGLGGLSTGCYAQMNGYESKIFEYHTKPGGVAAVWRRGDYLIDGGIHFLICHKPGTQIYDVYKEIGAVGSYEIEDMTKYMRFVDETGTKSVEFTMDLEKLERDLIELSPEDADEIRKFVKEVDWMKDSPLLTDLGMSTSPPELRGRFDTLKDMWNMRGFMKYFTGKWSKSATGYSEYLKDPFLKILFKNLFTPTVAIWFVIMIMATVAAGLLGLFKGGCHEFIEAIVKKYESLGGEIQYRAKVEKILVEDDVAVGVVLSDETEHRADIVVSAADGRSTIYDMLGGKYVDSKIQKRYDTWKPYDPMVIVTLGVDRVFEKEAPFTIYIMKEPLEYGGRAITCLPLRVMNYGDAFAPEGKTVIQVMLETDWDYWYDLRQNHDEYKEVKKQIAEEIIKRLDVHYPGISSQIEMTDVATPYTSWRYTLNDKGSPMGWLLTRSTLTELIPRTLPGLDNFYMAGHWVLPGGGVPGSIYTGRNVIQILCKKEGREFRSKSTE
ncbi:MAG: NAD(P)/FAD-dependent oxidoreductase [Candidatus Thorarchaeota archaeon]|nr:MAG: NAD(P)/FAD-dependent oxidoreductase [Candidatus Thorarchaeota archaeon]